MNVGVIGSGSMGSGIAQIAASKGHAVKLYDENKSSIENAINKINKILDRLIEKGKISKSDKNDTLNNIKIVSSINDFTDVDIVIEAIIEDLEVKKSVFKKLDNICKADCVLASNTSSFSLSSIASSCVNSNRVIGIHFFNPAPIMPLVEIIPALQTSNYVIDSSRELIDSWGKVTVVAKDTPGFIVNRIARPFYGEALRIYEEGIANFSTIDWVMTEKGGFRMGPFTLMDFIGNDINYAVTESVFNAFYCDSRYKPSFTQKRYSDAGWLGRKTGKGYFDYSNEAIEEDIDKDERKSDQIFRRILLMLINEAADALFLNIASRDDIDLAMTKGVNYPKGLLKWADEIGIDSCVAGMDQLYEEYKEDRYRCSPILRRMAKSNNKFY